MNIGHSGDSQPRTFVQENASKLWIKSAPKPLYFWKVDYISEQTIFHFYSVKSLITVCTEVAKIIFKNLYKMFE